jgi:hypothetical protein
MEDFLGKLLIGIFAWFVALFVVELIKETIRVVCITIEEIRNQLRNRSELAGKGISHVVISDFIKNSDCTVVTLDALKANGERVGKIKMQGQTSTVQKGMTIAI